MDKRGVIDACEKLWKGEDPLKHMVIIKENRKIIVDDGNLTRMVYLCLLLGQLHLNLLYVKKGGKGFCNWKKFRSAFSRICRLLPFPKSESTVMKKKVVSWTTSKDFLNVYKCTKFVPELKGFFQMEYNKLEKSLNSRNLKRKIDDVDQDLEEVKVKRLCTLQKNIRTPNDDEEFPAPKININKKVKPEQRRIRRSRKRWTMSEIAWLQKGVQAHGPGKWREILRMFPFVNRTAVNLKDKYRNMKQNGEIF